MKRRIFLVAMISALLLQPALADTRDEVWAAMERCQALQDDRTWLECTYGAKQPMRASRSTKASGRGLRPHRAGDGAWSWTVLHGGSSSRLHLL